MRSRRTWAAVLAVLVGSATLVGCSGDDSGGSEPVVIEVTFADGDVTPKGERVEAGTDQPIDFEITADEPGTIHVHSVPEQEFDYDAGSSTHEITVDKPGLVDVESHQLDQVIVQLEVS